MIWRRVRRAAGRQGNHARLRVTAPSPRRAGRPVRRPTHARRRGDHRGRGCRGALPAAGRSSAGLALPRGARCCPDAVDAAGQVPVVDQHGQELLDKEWVAFSSGEDPPRRTPSGGWSHRVGHRSVPMGGRHREPQGEGSRRSGGPQPSRPELEELGSGGAEEEDRHALTPVEDGLEEVEQGRLRPMDVLDQDDQGLLGRQQGEVRRTAQAMSSAEAGSVATPRTLDRMPATRVASRSGATRASTLARTAGGNISLLDAGGGIAGSSSAPSR